VVVVTTRSFFGSAAFARWNNGDSNAMATRMVEQIFMASGWSIPAGYRNMTFVIYRKKQGFGSLREKIL
jgi:cellulase/cellobiase CelA1